MDSTTTVVVATSNHSDEFSPEQLAWIHDKLDQCMQMMDKMLCGTSDTISRPDEHASASMTTASTPLSTSSLAFSASPAVLSTSAAATTTSPTTTTLFPPSPTSTLPAMTAAPISTPVPVAPCAEDQVPSGSSATCSTQCRSHDVVLALCTAAFPLGVNKGCSLEFMQSRYTTTFYPSHSTGVALFGMAIDVPEAHVVIVEMHGHNSMILWPHAGDVQPRQPWPSPRPFEFTCNTSLLVCSTACYVFCRGKSSKGEFTRPVILHWPLPQAGVSILLLGAHSLALQAEFSGSQDDVQLEITSEEVQLRPTPWPSFWDYAAVVHFQNSLAVRLVEGMITNMQLLFHCSLSGVEIMLSRPTSKDCKALAYLSVASVRDILIDLDFLYVGYIPTATAHQYWSMKWLQAFTLPAIFMSGLMEDDLSWEALSVEHVRIPTFNFRVISEASNGGNEFPVSLDVVVPDDILEKIFTFLPIASMIRSTTVCKRWHDIIYSSRFLWTHMLPQRPWYFMFTCNETAAGYAYDPILHKWYDIELQCIGKSSFVSSSCGLVCFMDNDNRSIIFVSNPITNDWKRLLEPPGAKFLDYSTVAIKVDQVSHNYTVTFAKSKQVHEDYVQCDFSLYKYDSCFCTESYSFCFHRHISKSATE